MIDNPILDMPLDDLELSVRSSNCLRLAGILTVGDLVKLTPAELRRINHFGMKSLNEIREVLASYGLALCDDSKFESVAKQRAAEEARALEFRRLRREARTFAHKMLQLFSAAHVAGAMVTVTPSQSERLAVCLFAFLEETE